MDTALWDEIVNGSRSSSLDSVVTLTPYKLKDSCIVSIYDPMSLCSISKLNLLRLDECGFLEPKTYKDFQNVTNIFDSSWLGTKILRYLITANLYVYTSENYLTNAICLINRNSNDIEKLIQLCERMKLCCCIYSPIPMDGFERINISTEEKNEYDQMYCKPHHLKMFELQHKVESNIPRYKNWYCKIHRYYIKECKLRLESINWMRRYLQWCWMKFLLPIAADENTVNILELTRSMIQNMKRITHVQIGLKFIMNAARCHPLQIAGVTTLIAFNKTLKGNEIPFRNFRYIFNQSLILWLHGSGDVRNELLTAWSYENDWIVNEKQRNLLETLMYVEERDLLELQYPRNLTTIWKLNQKKIQNRILCNYANKTHYVNKVIRLLYELG